MHSPDRILPKDPNEPINYHNLEPGDTIIFDTQTPVRDGTLGIVTHVADNGVDAFILSTVRPFHASAIVHMQDPRLTDTTIRASMLGRGVFRLTAATEKLRTLVFTLPAVKGEVVRLRSEVRRLCQIIDPPKPEEEEGETIEGNDDSVSPSTGPTTEDSAVVKDEQFLAAS